MDRITSMIYPMYTTYVEDGCSSSECFKGYYSDALHAVQSVLNFTYTVQVNNAFGVKQTNGSWTGQIGVSLCF